MIKLLKRLGKKKIIIIITVACIVLTTGIITYTKISKSKDKSDQQTIEYQVKKGTVSSSVSVSGTIETANYLSVTTSVNGIVKQVFVKEGETVVKGQKLMEITLNADGEENLASAWGSYLSAKIALDNATKQLISAESTFISAEEDFNDEKEDNSYQSHDERISYKLAENSYTVAKQGYEIAKQSITEKKVGLNKAWLTYQAQSPTIVAPDNGVIANIVVVEGMDITNSLSERTSSTVAAIKKEGSPIATLNVSEVDIAKIQVGQKVILSLNSIEGKNFSGIVAGIDKVGTSSSGVANYPVIVKFDESNDNILPNMGVEAEIIIEEKESVVYVPNSAVLSERGKKYLTVNGQKVEITIGLAGTKFTEVISGITEGDIVTITSLPTSGFTEGVSSQNRGGGMGIPMIR